MNSNLLRPASRFVIIPVIILALSVVHSPAAITVVGYWRLGEMDPGAAAGTVATNAIDSIGAHNLVFAGGPAVYSSDVSATAFAHTGSSLSVNFTNSSYATNSIVSAATDNFGIECWVKPTMTSGSGQIFAYNGNTATSGWGIVLASNNVCQLLFGGVTALGTNILATNDWVHLALVRDSGLTTLYINGVAALTNALTPHVPSGNFGLGAPPQSPHSQFFNGLLDEVRAFTFAPGQFTNTDLLLGGPVPTVVTGLAGSVSNNTALLNGSVNSFGVGATAWFEWGTNTAYGQSTPVTNLVAANVPLTVTNLITGLAPGTTYHFQLIASNSVAIIAGGDATFTNSAFVSNAFPFVGVFNGSAAWGDFNNDGYLDILYTGIAPGGPVTELWRNNGNGTFSPVTTSLPGVYAGSLAWGDYDNDGYLDILIAGDTPSDEPLLQLWHNNGNGTFSNINVALPGVTSSSVAWGDYDNDGRLDILISGYLGSGTLTNALVTQVWRNNGDGAFSNINAGLPGINQGAAVWGDFDNDGWLDIAILGYGANGPITQIWRNINGTGVFSNINAGLPGLYAASAAWGDYNNDGRLDLLISGNNGSRGVTLLYKNNGDGTFSNVNVGLPGLTSSSVAWGDYDNDGWPDILLSGNIGNTPVTEIWHNNGNGTFSQINDSFPALSESSAVWGDFNNDGRLDFFLGGYDQTATNEIAGLWQNETPVTNTPPTVPSALRTTVSGSLLTFHWNPSSDQQTPSSALTYNLRVGSASGASDVISPMSAGSGLRRLPQMGGVQLKLSYPFPFRLLSNYYWSVQAVDGAYGASAFAPEKSIRLDPIMTPVNADTFVPGDTNGDGVVDASELGAVLAGMGTNGISQSNVQQVFMNYFSHDPLLMTNVAGLGNSRVTFSLLNSPAPNLTVQSSTNLTDWQTLGPAIFNYQFTDTNAPIDPNQFYRLVYP